ncbi:unnamed protein product, partial [marine sediment metagenome]
MTLLVGWDGVTRRLVRVTPAGVIRVCSGRAKGIYNIQADANGYTTTCADCPVSEVMLRSFPDNSGRVFVNIGIAAALNVGYPLFTGEW